ncbi:histidine kinase [Solirubrobacter ginsenosidimutans]|uniref:histidine kinase n=1 Tax=Solirubrobacter ginsenosidimutans TaxID=490573 RepID=A0A9X3MYQ1_9ACTN|nr:histidine kinase [Solirubrobacter ginsenosidimutans]MDA0163597.1 histidine kinase [Solirubrobacter ginsenosidimutans]
MSTEPSAPRRLLIGLAAFGVVACVVPLALAIHSVGGHHRDLIAVFGPVIGGASIGTGLLAWQRRPENRFGALLVAVGFTYCLSGLIVSTDSWPFIAGLVVIAVPYAILFHILLAFPSGRLRARWEIALAGASYLLATVGWWICLVFEQTANFGLPANPLLIAEKPGLFDVLSRARLALVAVLIALLIVIVWTRWRRATRPQRRALTLVYASGGLVLALYAVWSVLGALDVATGTQETLERARVIALATVPFAFLAGLLRSRVAGATAVSDLVARLGGGGVHGSLRDALASALGDPSLTLAYWLPEREDWVDATGGTITLPRPGGGRACTPVERDSEQVAMLVHDASVAEERELVQAVVGAAALALENERLAAELHAKVKELQASRARIVESADAARRRIERDLHDGAQQRLVALSLSLQVARRRIDNDPGAAKTLLETAASDLDAAIRELRDLARGIHPAVLSDRGLSSAVEALAQRMPLPVEIVAAPQERLPEPVEAAAYFVVAEAITNVVRYAHATFARVDIRRDDGRLVVEVADDGIGGADPGNGSGLRGLADRVAALDGRLEVESEVARGTVVRALIPCG